MYPTEVTKMATKRFNITLYFTDHPGDPASRYGEKTNICEVKENLKNARIEIGMDVALTFLTMYDSIPDHSPLKQLCWEKARIVLRKLTMPIYVWKVFTDPLRSSALWNTKDDTQWYICVEIDLIEE